MDYTLGLDIGISSIGWAVVQNDTAGEPIKIEDLGVRVFTKAEHPKTGASLASPRREARGARRRIRRCRHRKERIRELLINCGLISPNNLKTLFETSDFEKDVYTLRAEGLDRQLIPDEWVRVLIHLSQRRGFRSNSKAEEAKDEGSGNLKKALDSNAKLMEAKGYRTVGEMFCKDEKFRIVGPDGRVWRHTRNSSGDYQFTVTRDMVEMEVRKLFAAQRAYGNPFAGPEMEEAYLKILLSQRNFDEGPGGNSPYRRTDLRGFCMFERQERRAFKACYTFEYFKLLNDLNRVRLLPSQGPTRQLTPQERESLVTLAMKTDAITYARVRKELGLPDEVRFQNVRYDEDSLDACEKKSKFIQMQSYHKIRKALDAVSKNYIRTLTQEQLDEVGTILSLHKSDDKRRPALRNIELEESAIQALLPLSFSKVGSLSLTAMRKLIPYLERGMRYDEACKEVYGDHRRPQSPQRRKTLSLPDLQESGVLEGITNPVVLRSISQTCKVVNAIIRKYGSPQLICVELAREMSRSFDERQKMAKRYEENCAQNQKRMEEIEEIKGSRPSGRDLVKYKLFWEQNGVCLYSGQTLDVQRLFEQEYVEVDHIIPYSISFDDSYSNKVLVLSEENRQKGNRLPLEYMAGDSERIHRFRVLVETTIRDYRKRRKLLKEEIRPEELENFKERNLSDTQYATRVVYNLLRENLEFAPSKYEKKPVRAVNGVVTDYMRKRFGLKKNRADGDLHHAMDAAVVAVTTDGMIQRISNYAKRREWGQKRTGNYVDPETGELLTEAAFNEKYAPHFPEPWPCFRRELEARLSADPAGEIAHWNLPHYDDPSALRPVLVSRMPNRKVTGPAHKDTICSSKEPGWLIKKTPLDKLKWDAQSGEIKNYYDGGKDALLYQALKARMQEFHGDAAKAFAQPFYKPKRDGTPGPEVHSVKTCEKTTSHVPACGGIAANGGMVRVDIFYVEGEGYYLVPIYQADTVKPQLPNRAVLPKKGMEEWKVMEDQNFLFSLYSGDLIRVVGKRPIGLKQSNKQATGEGQIEREEWILYYVSLDINTASICVETHDRKYCKSSMGVKTLSTMEKYEVGILGDYHKVHLPEKRQTFWRAGK